MNKLQKQLDAIDEAIHDALLNAADDMVRELVEAQKTLYETAILSRYVVWDEPVETDERLN